MEQRSTKNYFQFNKGLNTESNEINFPDGFSTDELNYELLVDGSRRRRKGLKQESGGSTKSMTSGQTIADGDAVCSYKWKNVGGNPLKSFLVFQVGHELYFTDDNTTPSASWQSESIDIATLTVGAALDSGVADLPCQFAQGRGVLLVTHPYCHPMYIEYDSDTGSLIAHKITITHRDYYGIDDGIAYQVRPAQATYQNYSDLSADHLYNLRNRGWSYAEITAFADRNGSPTAGDYPSKAHIWHSGYELLLDLSTASASESVGTRSDFLPDKVLADITTDSTAPQGSLLLDPLDTTFSASTSNDYGDDPEVQISDWSYTSGNPEDGGTVEITTAEVHGRIVSDFITISGNKYFTESNSGAFKMAASFNQSWEVQTVPSTTTLTITIPARSGLRNVATKSGPYDGKNTASYGQLNGNVALPKSDGETLQRGPTACGFYAGRAWFAGINSSTYADTVFFSQIAQKAAVFGACYAKADPTDPREAQVVADDGGFIVIPNLGKVQRMLPMRDALLIFSNQGVWEVSGARGNTFFTATDYTVRKVTESECTSPYSARVIGNQAIYTGDRGIHSLSPNQYTSLLEEQNISLPRIQTLWNDIPTANQEKVQTVYDEALDRIYFLYDDGTAVDSHHYQFCLVLDLRVGAYYKWKFNETEDVGVMTFVAISDADSSNSNAKVKWLVEKSTSTFDICDLNQTDYLDFDGAESPLPYVLTGWDNVGDFQRRKQAPVITVFAKRTETGYTDNGTGYDAVNESSNILTAYWDWSDNSVSGKIGSSNETYRHVRGFTPASPTDVDGYPVVVTRNKVRGRGRVLQLRFDGASGKDSHILGFSTNYKITRKI